ncbi:hypothetical protein TNCV_2376701 [Trichonephila clavipes]|nr:hypothetical protein TNCV_2376701 [Trichonephila clavipes]
MSKTSDNKRKCTILKQNSHTLLSVPHTLKVLIVALALEKSALPWCVRAGNIKEKYEAISTHPELVKKLLKVPFRFATIWTTPLPSRNFHHFPQNNGKDLFRNGGAPSLYSIDQQKEGKAQNRSFQEKLMPQRPRGLRVSNWPASARATSGLPRLVLAMGKRVLGVLAPNKFSKLH